MRIVRDLPSWWHDRRTRYAGVAAAVVALVVAVVLVVPGGEAPQDALSTEDPTPTATAGSASATPTPTPTPDNSPAATPEPSAEGSASSTSSPAAREPIASPDLLLPAAWVDATFGHGRPQHEARRGPMPRRGPFYCFADADHAADRGWSWPDETMLLEDLRTWRSEAAAQQHYDSCTDSLMHLARTSYPVHSRSVDLADEAVVIRSEQGLVVETVGVTRVGTTVVLFSLQSGRVASDAPAERALRAAVARLLGRTLPDPEPAPAPEPVPEALGYLGGADLDLLWASDQWVEGSLPCRSPSLDGPPTPPLRLAVPTVSRSFYASVYDPEAFHWEFLRGRAPDEQTARDDFAACRAALSDAQQPLSDVGDEAFCSRHSEATSVTNGGFRCLARRGDTYFVYSDSSDWMPEERARPPLLLAISRDPGR